MVRGIFGGVIPTLERILDIRSYRHRVLASNIANEETPGYKARDVDFQKELNREVSGMVRQTVTNRRHLSGTGGPGADMEVITRRSPDISGDNNSVNLEKEMVRLTENAKKYSATATILGKKFQMLREAIKEGR